MVRMMVELDCSQRFSVPRWSPSTAYRPIQCTHRRLSIIECLVHAARQAVRTDGHTSTLGSSVSSLIPPSPTLLVPVCARRASSGRRQSHRGDPDRRRGAPFP